MPASGSIGICTCPQGACSSISTAVGIGNGSLVANADYAGKSRNMRAFYGYNPAPPSACGLSIQYIICCSSGNLYPTNRTGCFNLNVDWGIGKGSGTGTAYLCVFCNGSIVGSDCCTIAGKNACALSGTFSPITICNCDTVCFCTDITSGPGNPYACLTMASVSNITGCWCLCGITSVSAGTIA